MAITLTINEFLASFPAFQSSDPALVINMIDQVLIETGGYDGLIDEACSVQAVKLHVAHLLTLENRTTGEFTQGGQGIKRLKSKHDEIEYAIGNPNDPYDLSTTTYGKRLERFLEAKSIGFTWGSFYCGC